MSRRDTYRPRTARLCGFQTCLKLATVSLLFWTNGFAASSETSPHIIPLKVDRNAMMTVKMTIMDRPAKGVIDTGATLALIDSRHVPRDLLKQSKKISVAGANRKRNYKVIHLPELNLSGQRFENVRAGINNRASFPGHRNVVPLNLLDGRVIDFDFLKSQALLYATAPKSQPGYVRATLPYTEHKGLLFVPVQIGGVEGQALVDTGSNRSFLNPIFVDRAKLRKSNKTSYMITGAGGRSARLQSAIVPELSLGGLVHRKTTINYGPLSIFAHLGVDQEPAMVMGLDILSAYRVQIDRELREIHLLMPEPNRSQAHSYESILPNF